MRELKPCPFCGGEAAYTQILGNYGRPHEVYCSTCDGGITEGRSKDGVIHNWNTRPIEDALNARIAELEAEIDQLTAHDATERQNDKCSKPEPNVCEACGGDGTVLLTDGYKGQVIATAKCIYCNGTGRVNKEREE
jgi:Lar family restriction alleviation protein